MLSKFFTCDHDRSTRFCNDIVGEGAEDNTNTCERLIRIRCDLSRRFNLRFDIAASTTTQDDHDRIQKINDFDNHMLWTLTM